MLKDTTEDFNQKSKQIDLMFVCKPFEESKRMVIAEFKNVPCVPQIGSCVEVPHTDVNGFVMAGKVTSVYHDAMSLWHVFPYRVSVTVVFTEEDFEKFWKEASERYASSPPHTNHAVWRPSENGF